MHEVLVNRLGGLSLPRKSVVRLTDRPDMTLDVYRGSKTTMQKNPLRFNGGNITKLLTVSSFPFDSTGEILQNFWQFSLSPSIQYRDNYKTSGSFLFPHRFNGGNITKLLAVFFFPFDLMGEILQNF